MHRSWSLVLPLGLIALLFASVAEAAAVEHTFNVGNLSISQLCQPARIITAVNGQLPGPTIEACEGDTVVVHLVNESPYNMTIHWHGIFQRGTPWADGPAMVTQCPVKPGATYTYRFNATDQEGTLWWHAHISLLRATVYGALVLRPRGGAGAYPFPKPHGEETVLLGEWWNANVHDLDDMAFLTGNPPRNADAYTINGKSGDFYNCSNANETYRFQVRRNETYLLRIINAALNTPMFFKVANHSFTVVGADAAYTTPYETDVVVVAPGQTVDALMVAGAAVGRYYMAASPYDSAIPVGPPFSMSTATAIVEYAGSAAEAPPQLPSRPEYNDTDTAFRFLSNLTALVLPGKPTVPLSVDTRMFVTVGLGNSDCLPKQLLCNTTGTRMPIFSASMNNASFVLPESVSMLQAHYANASAGVYTRDFPDRPPVIFDYTADASDNATLKYTPKSTKVKTLRYNETVEMVLQNTRLIAKESHPMHLHGFNFFVLAQGFGNYNEAAAKPQFNLVNPQERNTVAVPTGGWAVIRFLANNPGMWFMHCHFDAHLDLGLAMVFEVQDGPTAETSVPPPPLDLPQC
ncbi:hypothetical protein SEVIR_3G329700v4 [Setaria viridis]|uniref:Laccase n=2 Tax=Setaria TaxID=4554 RepID=K3Z4Y3_SETIT|nr:laccase-25 [Setaria italica]XP_034584577.1 laccase-25-like [Setaria viridis]RCV18385.1 hypothetical protein SETIT_3G297100v2 [Setaria italica]TKW28156.1 hypothetical protein SEVIR_3G329700v2 [Setaria viridis]